MLGQLTKLMVHNLIDNEENIEKNNYNSFNSLFISKLMLEKNELTSFSSYIWPITIFFCMGTYIGLKIHKSIVCKNDEEKILSWFV